MNSATGGKNWGDLRAELAQNRERKLVESILIRSVKNGRSGAEYLRIAWTEKKRLN